MPWTGPFWGAAAAFALGAALAGVDRASGGSEPTHDLVERIGGHFIDASPIGLIRIDAAGLVATCNPAMVALLGRTDDEPPLLGLPFLDLIHGEDRTKVATALAEAAAPGGVRTVEARLLSSRRTATVSLHVGLPPSASLPATGDRLAHVIDITAFKELEGQIVQSRKMQAVGQLAGGIAHDFNNLLTAMIGFCDLLLLRHRAGDQSFADIMQIKQNANRAASLVRQLLAFSRQQTLRPRVLDITETLTELSNLLRRLIGPTVVLNIHHGRDLGLVKVDQGQFEQVIINMAVNARDAMSSGGTLTIRTSNTSVATPVRLAHETMPSGDYVLIEVIDDGSGIPAEVVGQIFEPFFTTKPVGMGTGLGLSTVYGIVRQTGGFVTVASEVGRGTAFSIYLPRHAGAELSAGRQSDDAQASDADTIGTGTILLVEDEDPVRLFTARALRSKGYKVVEAKSGEVALDLLDRHEGPLDLLITDAVMPVIDGPTLIKMVRNRLPTVRVICISGHTDEDLRTRINQAGDVSFLPKPFSLKQLAGRVTEVMRGPPGGQGVPNLGNGAADKPSEFL
jgi:two-component system cell cycle sensor histidine kinase/response regulator CckA